MNKIIKCAIFGMLFLLPFLGITKVHAEQYTGQAIWPSEYISNIYIKKIRPDGTGKYQQARFIRRSEDNKFVYCLQPFVDIDNDLPYYDVIRSDYEKVLGLSEEQWTRISLLAYYGYDYENHTEQKWYVITQVLIWRTVNPDFDIYFTDTLNGNRINKFESEIAELEKLVANHYKRPNISVNETLSLGETINVSDSNEVLNKYKITSTENVNASINGNQLSITATGIGNGKINLTLKDTKYELPSIVYFSDHSQNVFRVGSYDPIYLNLNMNVIGGKVEINKVDNDCNCTTPSGEATLAGAKYGVYTYNGQLLETLTTDEKGYAISNYLPSIGTFYIQELSSSKGYEIDAEKHYFEINENNILETITSKEKVIKNFISILKQYDYVDGDTKFLNAEKNVEFEIYDSKNNLYTKIVTDKNGYATINLPYGVYKFHQVNSTNGYEKIYDFYITVDEKSEKEQYYNILNNALSAYLQVYKIDAETNDVISLSDVTFKILNTDTNQYVSQYVGGKVYSEFKTDETGRMVTYLKLSTGNYKLIEVSNPKGYVIDEDGIPFSIGNDTYFNYTTYGAFVTIKYKNSPIKGKIEINKSGEEVAINEQGINYENIKPLSDVEFELYAAEDILSSDNTHLYYSKNDMIQKIITDENGYGISIDLPLGKYYLKETSTNSDYVLDTENYEIELKELDNKTKLVFNNIDLVNKLKKGTMEFTKTDFVTGQVIPNVLIEIYTENDELIFSGKTNENGQVVINELPVNMKFYIKEIEPANGYILNDEKIFFEIKEDGEIVKCNMTNEQITIEVPNTDIKDSVDLTFIIVIAELVVGIIIYAKINKK